MIDKKSAYLKAKKMLTKDIDTMFDEIYYYLELEETFVFFSGLNKNEYTKGNVVSINKKGGKALINSYYNFCLIHNEIDFGKIKPIIDIENVDDNSSCLIFNDNDLEKENNNEISRRDLIFNLVDSDVPLRSLLKADEKGITINNIKFVGPQMLH